MDREEAAAALKAAEAHRQTVRAAARWPVLVLVAFGCVMFAVDFTTAFVSGPWTLIPASWAVIFAGWGAWYAHRQRVAPLGFLRRYLLAVVAGMLLHGVYLAVLIAAGLHGDPLAAFVGSLVVAAPFFIGAHVESRAW
ncbi:hypothetical protein [Herbidospora mongoliensis]|uniref:hypothetical protein n=1 Tax=Herbidospora mongoliensis TaxID=688067 RepID=UPI00082EAED9|nr:hypothetical protein [Herbidospora mongoliensis]